MNDSAHFDRLNLSLTGIEKDFCTISKCEKKPGKCSFQKNVDGL